MKRFLAFALCICMVLAFAACGSSNNDKPTGTTANTPETTGTKAAVTGTTSAANPDDSPKAVESPATLRVLYSTELTTLNYLTTPNTYEVAIPANVIDTLLECDNYGELKPSLAESWSYNAETKEWTFKIREGAKWVNTKGEAVADVTANDFVSAAKYILDPAMGSSTVQNLFGIIENAEEYYNGLAYKDGSKTEDGKDIPAGFDEDGNEWPVIDFATVGVKATDAYTLVYKLTDDVPYFLSSLVYVCYMPAYGEYLDQYKEAFATNADNMLYCGAYYISEYVPSQKQVLKKNTLNYDAEHVYIDTIERTYNAEANSVAPEMVKRGDTDYADLEPDVAKSWLEDATTKSYVSLSRATNDYSYFYCFNFDPHFEEKYEPENWKKAVNNENFRKSLMAALNRAGLVKLSGVEEPYEFIFNTITPDAFSVNNGKDYTSLDAFSNIMSADSYNKDKALEYKDKAIAELTAEGATFPIKVLVKYNPSVDVWASECSLLEQEFEALFGKDYIDVIVEAGPSTGFLSEVRRSGNYAFLKCNWGADYADPETWTDPFYQDKIDGGYKYAFMYQAIADNSAAADTVKEYFSLVEAAKKITTDLDARYDAFAKAEAYLIEHALAVPYGVSVSDYVATKLNMYEAQYAPFGVSVLRYKGQHLYDRFLSLEDLAAFKAEYEKNAK
ncbi:MAG: peptide ABC transporter substrate-binding protein [Clostridia bacterium]|nr:peptide ABC transporter substrate-binding protein [Clostridia bacterium]